MIVVRKASPHNLLTAKQEDGLREELDIFEKIYQNMGKGVAKNIRDYPDFRIWGYRVTFGN